MNIKPSIYDNLTPRQRLIATIEAMARHDDAEHKKLADTCPKKRYEQGDYQYSGTLQGLTAMAFCIEQTLTSNALSALLCLQYSKDEIAEIFIQRTIDTYTAWTQHLEVMGIDPRAMDKIVKDIRHPYVDLFLKMPSSIADSGEVFVADENTINAWTEHLNSFFKRFLNV